jgi:hypothetical protein
MLVSCLFLLGLSIGSCRREQSQSKNPSPSPTPGPAEQSDELKRLENLAGTLKLDLGKITNRGAARNTIGLKSTTALFSQRRDSRTYFLEDGRYGEGKEYGVFQGSDAELLENARTILQKLNIPTDEINEAKVIAEKTQTGQVDRPSNKLVMGEVRDGKKIANLTRQIKGIPVFSSHARIGLTKDKRIGFMEVHWPEISAEVVGQGQKLQEMIKGEWRAPDQKGSRVESVDVGIIHSPALGFVMDIYPAIRVIYAPEDAAMGRKLMLYLDGNGKSVTLPRQFEKLEEPRAKSRPSPSPSGR